MARSSYKQLNKEADQCGYGTFENWLIQKTFDGNQEYVDFLIDTASLHAIKMVLRDLTSTLGECQEWYSREQVAQVSALAMRIIEKRIKF